MLSLTQGGATARPFITHYNALDLDTYLRIALELPLKRLIVGGMEKVFEIGRIFRNEGLDTRHNPEFTMLEAYEAFVDYTEMMALLEDLVSSAAEAAIGTTNVVIRGEEISLAPPYRRRHHGRPHPRAPRRRRPPLACRSTPSTPCSMRSSWATTRAGGPGGSWPSSTTSGSNRC